MSRKVPILKREQADNELLANELTKDISHKIPILDLSFSAYHYLKGNIPELDKRGGRVIFLFNANETFYKLSDDYNGNVPVNCLDFVNAMRELKAKMLAMKGNDGTGKGVSDGYRSLS